MKFFNLRKDDISRREINAWRRFSTKKETIATPGVWVPISVAKNAAEIRLESTGSFSVSESNSSDGTILKLSVELQILDMETIYIKTTVVDQDVFITEGLL